VPAAPKLPDGAGLQHRYRVLRRLLAANSELLEGMADLEADLALLDPGQPQVRRGVLGLLDGSLLLAENLNVLTGHVHAELYAAHRRIACEVRQFLRSREEHQSEPLVLPLDEVGVSDTRLVGGKAANLGELRTARPDLVPGGFVLTAAAFRMFLEANNLHQPIRALSRDLDLLVGRPLFRERCAAIRALVGASPLPGPVLAALGDALAGYPKIRRWAVRSSAVGEDGQLTFAGQFESVLDVAPDGVPAAYARVLASRWNDRAVVYRLFAGVAEVETPMAVVLIPMLEARWAGVLYTRDPAEPTRDHLLAGIAAGLADAMVRGESPGATVALTREPPGDLVTGDGSGVPRSVLEALARAGLAAESHLGGAQDVEWVAGHEGTIQIVQARPLRTSGTWAMQGGSDAWVPVLSGGMTIFPGRATGQLHVCSSLECLAATPEGAILVLPQATPELAVALPSLAGVIAEYGNPTGHAAALVREFAGPALFGVAGACERLQHGTQASLDASQRKVYAGTVWPEIRERVRARIRHSRRARRGNLLHQRVLALNLIDPLGRNFRARSCESIHDIVRFCHETAVAAMFRLGDQVAQGRRRVWKVESPRPLNLWALDLGGALPVEATGRRAVLPENIGSEPFQALWRGMNRPGVHWAGRRQVNVRGFASVLSASLHDPGAAVRELGGANYVLVAPDYVSANARLAYHFAMVDALVTSVAENNFVNFRFRGGGAGEERRARRARFLSEVLLRSGFGVDRRGDLVTAWVRRFPAAQSLAALEVLGALMGCARQLDMMLRDEAESHRYVDAFLAGDYDAFS
jgi:pyruvate, water dikinase